MSKTSKTSKTAIARVLGPVVILMVPCPPGVRAGDCPQREYGWAVTAGDVDFDTAKDVAFDAEGNAYLAGFFRGCVNFDPEKGRGRHCAKNDMRDAFVASYDTNGLYRWSVAFNNKNRYDYSLSLYSVTSASVDRIAYGGGYVGKADFNPGKGKDVRRSNDDSDPFVTVLGTDGRYRWTATFEGPGPGVAHGLASDAAGNLIATGVFTDTIDLDPGRGVDLHESQGGDDAFVVKLSADGSFQWGRTWGGPAPVTLGWGVAADAEGNVIVSGLFEGLVDFDPGPGEDWRESAGKWDAFIMKFDPDGERLWAATFGGSDLDGRQMNVAVDSAGNIYYTSYFNGFVDFDPTEGVDRRYGYYDVFVTSLAPDGSYRWTWTFGGDSGEWGTDIAVSSNGNEVVTVVGFFEGTVDFDPGEGVDERTVFGVSDAFVTRYTTLGDYLSTDTFGGTVADEAGAVAVNGQAILTCGVFNSPSTDFDPTTGEDVHFNHSDTGDIFVTKLYCGPCEAVERHSLVVSKDKIIGEVRALVPGGRVTVECMPTDPPGEPIERQVNIDGDNTGSYKLKKLDKGEYACAITEVRDADGEIVCDEPAGRRVVKVK